MTREELSDCSTFTGKNGAACTHTNTHTERVNRLPYIYIQPSCFVVGKLWNCCQGDNYSHFDILYKSLMSKVFIIVVPVPNTASLARLDQA